MTHLTSYLLSAFILHTHTHTQDLFPAAVRNLIFALMIVSAAYFNHNQWAITL